MAGIFRGQGSSIARSLALLPALSFAILATPAAMAQLSEQPMLVVDPGLHTAAPIRAAVDAAGRFAVTGSYDKTVRVWSLADGKLLQTIHMPAGPDNIGKIYAVAMSPDGALVAAGGWTVGIPGKESIYLFETRTGKMTARIAGLPQVNFSLAFSLDGRYLAAGLGGRAGLRVYDRDRQWSEVFRDTDYGDNIFGATFAADGRLATASRDGKVRLYDPDFKLVVPARKATGGNQPHRIAFSPDGTVLAVGYGDAAIVDLFEGRSLAPLPRPNVDGLRNGNLGSVTWSKDGIGFELWGKSPLRFDLRAIKLVRDPSADQQMIRAKQTGLAVDGWRNEFSPTLDGKPIQLEPYERSRSLAIPPDAGRFVLGTEWKLRAIDAMGKPLWTRIAPGVVWAVNITGDGRGSRGLWRRHHPVAPHGRWPRTTGSVCAGGQAKLGRVDARGLLRRHGWRVWRLAMASEPRL
jgi:outer membrane protein assembly factor BamB